MEAKSKRGTGVEGAGGVDSQHLLFNYSKWVIIVSREPHVGQLAIKSDNVSVTVEADITFKGICFYSVYQCTSVLVWMMTF